jgi:ribosomal protein L21E
MDVVKPKSSAYCDPRFMIEVGYPMREEMMSLLLSAFHTGSKVDLYVEGCISNKNPTKGFALLTEQ